MKLKIATIILIFAINLSSFAQNYAKYMQQGKEFYNKSEYFTALERFDFASEFAKTETEKDDAKSWKNKSREKIKDQQNELKKVLAKLKNEKSKLDSMMRIALTQKLIADKEREIAEVQRKSAELQRKRAEAALKLAEEMQSKMESAVFDRAVKDIMPEWKNASVELFDDNYSKIKNLNLSYAGLSRIPWEVYQCKNLKSINLINNDLKDLNKVFEGLSNLQYLKDIKITLQVIDSFPEKYKNKVTGIKYYSEFLMDIPPSLFSFKTITYLDLSGYWQEPKQYEARDITMGSYERNRRNLPVQIGELTLLETLNLSGNGLNKLPTEISKLKNLKGLILADNIFPDSEKQRIKNLLPNCEISF